MFDKLQIALGAAAICGLLLVGWRFDHLVQVRKIEAVHSKLIHSQRDVADLKAAIASRNADIAREKAKGDAIERQAQEAAAEARKEALQARRTLDAFMARKPVGDTVCARVEDVAGQIREAVK